MKTRGLFLCLLPPHHHSGPTGQSMNNILRGIAVGIALPISLMAQPQSETVPRALAEALLARTGYGMDRPQISVGELPPSIAPKVKLPSGTKILGGMTFSQGALAVVSVDGTLNSAAEAFHKDLLAQGWEIPVDDPMSFMRNEFIDPPSSDRRVTRNGMPDMYCGKAGTLNVSYQPDGIQRTQVTIGSTAVNQCAVQRDMMFRSSMGGMNRDQTRPKLVNHPAARNSPGSCQNYNMGMGDRRSDLGSQLAPSEILSHYTKQLADSGWTQIGSTVAAVFQKRDTSGTLMEYQLLVHAPGNGPGCRSVRSDFNATSR